MADRRSRVGRVLGLAELGHAQWFFGNLYEAVVRVPDLLADRPGPMPVLGRGSPVRYFAVSLPGTLPAVLAAAVASRRDRAVRPWLLTAAACSLAGLGLTGYLVRTVNRSLFFGAEELTPEQRADLLRTWHRLNSVRLVTAAGALLATRTARARLSAGESTVD